ncbi:MAG: chitobiase/beta-hexosaminidase C-terminal domain-containing protein [Bacteroidetes bacterium]|nr:chitobiase/beta-hexosaminidase C-terminal domain-containing protein [Bacteroidota bacterium]
MQSFKRILENAVFALNILAVFLLFTNQWLVVPSWLQIGGRLHPLLVHFPVTLVLLGVGFLIFAESESSRPLLQTVLLAAALTSSLTAISGFFLSKEGGYDHDVLTYHRWAGVMLSILSAILYYAISSGRSRQVIRSSAALSTLAVVIAGHLGATLTHGEGYLTAPLFGKSGSETYKVDSTMFSQSIGKVMEAKCFGCHNRSKAKGDLVLTSAESILKGGKHGSLWKPGDPSGSLIIQRLELGMDEKNHMPPKDKPQLTASEMKLINHWIAVGADMNIKLDAMPTNDSLRGLALSVGSTYLKKHTADQRYHFAFASAEEIQMLNTPFRFVSQVAISEPALQADFFVRQAFRPESIEELSAVADQIVSINLTNMPVKDEDLSMMSKFVHLERLILNNTDVTDQGVQALKRISSLQSLALSGTAVTDAAIDQLASMPGLRDVFIWNTKITQASADAAGRKYANINWQTGYVPNSKEVLQLSAPLAVNESQLLQPGEPIKLKATIPGAVIRYTTDGSEPDSVKSPVYNGPVSISSYTLIKAKAYREGWKSSATATLGFFCKGLAPEKATLLTPSDKKYPGNGINTLIDSRKGFMDFFRDPSWMAFRDNPLEAVFHFPTRPKINSVTISFAKDVGAETMPPEWMEIYGGNDDSHLTLIRKVVPTQPAEYGTNQNEGIVVPLGTSYTTYKVIAQPLNKLPAFRKAPKDKGWLMVDEIFFN